jgi:hypothetical protein
VTTTTETDLHSATRLSRGLVWANAVAWALLLPATAVLGIGIEQLSGQPQLQGAGYLIALVVAAVVNVVGALGLAHTSHLLRGPGRATAIAALVQFGAVAGACAAIGYSLFLEAYGQIGPDESELIFVVAISVAVPLYIAGHVALGLSLRPLSRRLGNLYAAAPLLFTAYGAALITSLFYDWNQEMQDPLHVTMMAVAGVLALVFFVAIPVLWFRLGVVLGRQTRAARSGSVPAAAEPPVPSSATT